MTLIQRAGYGNENIHTRSQSTLATQETGKATSTKKKETTSLTGSMDKVSLSKDLQTARTRESMGLNPTGPLKLKDFTQAATAQAQTVEQELSQTLKALNIDPATQMTLTLDAKGQVTIPEKFAGKNDLVKALNNNSEFMTAFRRLSANESFLGQIGSSNKTATSLADVMNSDTDWENIISIAQRNKALQTSNDPLATLVDQGHQAKPYTYTHPKAS